VKRAISFCFDDGFRRSAQTIAELFSRRRLPACFAVLSRPEQALDPYVRGADLGDWSFWREMVAAGHEVAPHGLIHERYDALSVDETKASVREALQIFETEMPGFERARSVFHVPYLGAPPAIVDWLADQCLGVRLALANRGLNRWHEMRRGAGVDCVCYGPDGVAEAVSARLHEFGRQEEGWLVLAMHGVDGEGWGPVSRTDLECILDEATAGGFEITTPNRLLLKELR